MKGISLKYHHYVSFGAYVVEENEHSFENSENDKESMKYPFLFHYYFLVQRENIVVY